MALSLQDAAGIYREALRVTVRQNALLYMSEGAFLAVAGILAIFYPLVTSAAIAVPLGWLLILSAVLQALVLYGLRSMPHFGFQLLSVVVAFLVGFLILRDPQQLQVVVLLVTMFLMLHGVSRLAFGFGIRPFSGWYWVAASGALGVVFALVLLNLLPDPPGWLVGLLVGAELVADGAAIALLGWAGRQEPVRA